MTPTDLTAFITRQESVEKQYRAVVLDRDEELVFRNAGGYTMLLPVPLCQHKHRQIEKAARCGLKAADKMRRAADGPERLHGGDPK